MFFMLLREVLVPVGNCHEKKFLEGKEFFEKSKIELVLCLKLISLIFCFSKGLKRRRRLILTLLSIFEGI